MHVKVCVTLMMESKLDTQQILWFKYAIGSSYKFKF